MQSSDIGMRNPTGRNLLPCSLSPTKGMGPSYATAQLQLPVHGGGIVSSEGGGGGMVQHLTPHDLDALVSRMVEMRLQQQQLADYQHGMDRGGQASASRAPHMEPILRGGGGGGGGGHKVRPAMLFNA